MARVVQVAPAETRRAIGGPTEPAAAKTADRYRKEHAMLPRITAAHVLFCAMLAVPTVMCGTGCAVDDTGDAVANATEAKEPVVIDETGDGQSFDVIEGQKIIVRLPGNATTGYEWTVASTDRTFGYPAESNYVTDDEAVGSGGVYEFIWVTKSPLSMVGTHTVTLQYKRSWETEAADEFTFTVNILGAHQQPTEVIVDESKEGKTVTVTEGTDVVVHLAGNPTTGYAWTVASTDRTFGYPESEQYLAADESIGGGGTYEFIWATEGGLSMVGKHTVTLQYKRSWESTAADTFTFKVDIKAAH